LHIEEFIVLFSSFYAHTIRHLHMKQYKNAVQYS